MQLQNSWLLLVTLDLVLKNLFGLVIIKSAQMSLGHSILSYVFWYVPETDPERRLNYTKNHDDLTFFN